MRLGMLLPRVNPGGARLSGDYFLISADRMEQAGFDSLWLTDALGRGYPSPDPLVALAAVASRTRRVTLGTSILQVPIRHPFELAHRIHTTDLLSGGRLVLGVGAGSTPADFAVLGVPFEERFARLDSSLRVMQALWRGEVVDGVALDLFDLPRPAPDILIGSWGGSRWIPRAATEFDGWIGSAAKTSWPKLEGGIRRFRSEGGSYAVVTNVVVDPELPESPDTDEGPLVACGLETARRRIERFHALGFDEVVLRTPDHADGKIAALSEAVLEAGGW